MQSADCGSRGVTFRDRKVTKRSHSFSAAASRRRDKSTKITVKAKSYLSDTDGLLIAEMFRELPAVAPAFVRTQNNGKRGS